METPKKGEGTGETPAAKGTVYELLRPIEFNGEKVTEIGYDLDVLTGGMIIAAEREFQKGSVGSVLSPYTSPMFLAELFARAARKPVALIEALKAPDFAEVTSIVQVFLQGQG